MTQAPTITPQIVTHTVSVAERFGAFGVRVNQFSAEVTVTPNADGTFSITADAGTLIFHDGPESIAAMSSIDDALNAARGIARTLAILKAREVTRV